MADAVVTTDSQHPTIPLTAQLSVAAAAVLAPVAYLFWPTLSSLPHIWDVDPNYSHGFVVPFATLFFFYRVYSEQGLRLSAREPADVTAGVIRIAAGLVLHIVAVFVGMSFVDVSAMILILSGVWIATLGRESYKPYAFPLWFLIFMAPLPARFYQALAINLQQLASKFSAFIFSATGVPVYQQGCHVRVSGYSMEVGAACSGVRQLMAIAALSMAIAHVSRNKTLFYKWTLSLTAIPVAVLANCFRVTMTGYIMIWFGQKWAEGVYHTLEGLVIVLVAALFTLVIAWWLAGFKICRVKVPASDKEKSDPGDSESESTVNEAPMTARVSAGKRTMVIVSLLALAVAGQVWLNLHLQAAGAPPKVPLKQPLKKFPLRMGDWVSPGDQEITDRLRVGDQHLRRTYINVKTRQQLSVWMVYSSDGADREHHPEVCMAVAGHPEDLAQRTTFPVEGHDEPIQQYRFGLVGGKQWVFYWYYTLPRPPDGELSGMQQFYRRMHNRPSSLTLEVFAPDGGPVSLREAQKFVQLLDKEIQRFVGKGAVRESRRMPVTIVDRPPPPQ